MSSFASPDAATTDRRVPQIDGLRALGMLMVYLFHAHEFCGNLAWNVTLLGMRMNLLGFLDNFGAGVDLFMVVSGFCLFWPLCKAPERRESWSWKSYVNRRVRRIVPPYYAAIGYAILLPVVLVALYHAMGVQAKWQPIPDAWQLFTHFTFIHSLFPSAWNGITGAFWSLGLEAQFYILFPFVVFAFRRQGTKVIWWGIAASVFYRVISDNVIVSHPWRHVSSITFMGRWMEFGFGMLTALAVANYWRNERVNPPSRGTLQVLGALALYTIGVNASEVPWFPVYELCLSVAFSLLIFGLCTSRTPFNKVFQNRVLDWLGLISYSLYLLHQPTAWYLSEFFKKVLHVSLATDFWLLVFVGFPVVVAFAYPFFLIFEKPGLTMNRSGKQQTPIGPEAADRKLAARPFMSVRMPEQVQLTARGR